MDLALLWEQGEALLGLRINISFTSAGFVSGMGIELPQVAPVQKDFVLPAAARPWYPKGPGLA